MGISQFCRPCSYSYQGCIAAASVYGYSFDKPQLFCLLLGESGAAYNVGDAGSDITLRELARLIADHAGTKVVFELPDQLERAGYSKATKALMDGSRLKALGWRPLYDLAAAIPRTMDILSALRQDG